MNNALSQIKISTKNMANGEGQVENRVSEREDMVEELDQTVKEYGNAKKT
jgi:hypothetical protein